MRMNWDEYFLNIAKSVSMRSNCLRHHIGAVIVSEDKRIKATGYNGTPSKVISCMEKGICYRESHNIQTGIQYETCFALHAEMNAIIQAGEEKCKNATMYIYGYSFICVMCKRFIVQSGLSRVCIKASDKDTTFSIYAEDIRNELNNVT